MIVYNHVQSCKVGCVTTMNTHLRNLPQLIILLQTLHRELHSLVDVDAPEDSPDGYNCMLKITEKMMNCVNPALVQVAGWGFGEKWEERIGLVWFKRCIESSWSSYYHKPNSHIPSFKHLQALHRSAIDKLANDYIIRLRKQLDCIEQQTLIICAGMLKRLNKGCLFGRIDKNIMYDIMSASVWRLD